VHRRNFRVVHAFPGLRIGEMEEEAPMIRQLFPEEPKSRKDALQRCPGRHELTLISDAKRSQAKSRSRDAGRTQLIGIAQVAAVLDHARIRASLIPEELKAGLLDVVKKLIILDRKIRDRADSWPGWRRR